MEIKKNEDIRWKQRYANYANMVKLLNVNLPGKDICDFNELEQVGLAKSFELAFELSWKLIKDYLEFLEVDIGIISPKNVLQTAGSAGLLEKMNVNGDILMNAHRARNHLVHVYDPEFIHTMDRMKKEYLPQLINIEEFFHEELNHE